MTDKAFSATKSIELFLHCGKCLTQRLPPRLEVGWTVQGLQVWCKNHECNVMHIDFEGAKHPAITSANDRLDDRASAIAGLKELGIEITDEPPITDSFMQATDHPYNCRCPICLDWWVSIGPDGGERDQFGPFEPDEVEARANALGVKFHNGDAP